MGDGSLNRCKDLMSYQVRYIFFQSLARDKARTMRENDAGEDCNWSEDPTLDFSVFRLKKNIDVYDRTGRVENTMVSPDYEPGSYLHLNPSEAPVCTIRQLYFIIFFKPKIPMKNTGDYLVLISDP